MTTNQPTTPDGRKIVVHRACISMWPGSDWVAYLDDEDEDVSLWGRGATEAEAVADLLSELEDAA